ncbi:MAG: Lrp/AsnC family transcriptional regulator [Planctomycetes bacterium]|nr:Lrp/AsnC family transcriptional regulator [Planctomycetota bacterium]
MDNLDRQIITELQMDFPISPDPYGSIADRLGIDRETLFQRVQALMESGVIRRIGVSVNSHKMGYASTLAAVRVPDSAVESASKIIDSYPEITHSYLRSDEFNVWFTVIAESPERIQEVLEELRIKLNIAISDVLDLPVKQLFKLDARFKPTT